MTDDDDLWVDSSDRKVALRALAEHRDEAHLTSTEHDRRRQLVQDAQTRADLRALFADLPSPHPLIGEERDGWEATPAADRAPKPRRGAATASVSCSARAVWSCSARSSPGGGSRRSCSRASSWS